MRQIEKSGGRLVALAMFGCLSAGCQSAAVHSPTAIFPDQSAPETMPETAAHQKTQTLLEATGDCVVDKQPLEAVIKSIASRASVNIVVRWDVLELADIKPTTPVSVELRNVPLGHILRTVLDLEGGYSPQMRYYIEDDGTVMVATEDYFATPKYQFVRAFNIAFLLDMIDPNATTDYLFPELVGGPAIVSSLPSDDEAADIVNIIKSSVAPDSWRDAGGTVGGLQIEDGFLIVNQTKENLNQIAVLLAKMRKVAEARIRAYDVRDLVGTDTGKLHQLMDLVEKLSPERMWIERGGRMGTMCGMSGFIFVNGAKHVHDEVAAELRVIRTTNPGLRPMEMVTPKVVPAPPDTMPATAPGSMG